MKLNTVIYVLLFLLYNVFPVKCLYGQENDTNVGDKMITSDGIEMTVRTDKASYHIDEPIMLEITITNTSGEDRYIHSADGLDIDNVYDITVLTPVFSRNDFPLQVKEIPPEVIDVIEKDIENMINKCGKPKPLNRTDFGSSLEHSTNKTKICLHPNARHIERIPLGLLYDLSRVRVGLNHTVLSRVRVGLNHTVIVKNKELSLETKVPFELKGNNVSGPYLTACRLSSMFGDRKAMRMLCIEAEKFMEKIEKTDGSMLLTAPEHDSLTRCLNIMNELLATVSNRRIVRKPWTRDEGCKMIDDCKKFLNH